MKMLSNEISSLDAGSPFCFHIEGQWPGASDFVVSRRLYQVMFAKQDKQFDEMATNPLRRREAIAGLSWRRDVMFWCAVVVTLCALATFFISLQKERGGAAALGFVAAVQWMLLFKFESDLRLLRVIERLHLSENDKTGD